MQDLFVINNNRIYKKALKREIRCWRVDLSKNKYRKNIGAPYKFSFQNSQYSLRNNLSWLEPIKKLGPANKVLMLGGAQHNLSSICRINMKKYIL
jgi:hypothetical protein